jgi:integrase
MTINDFHCAKFVPNDDMRRSSFSTSILQSGVRALLWRRKRPDGSRHPHWTAQFVLQGETHKFSTKETNVATAELRVREKIEEMVTGYAPLQRPGHKATWATIGDILIAYKTGAIHAKKATLRTNENALRQIVEAIHQSSVDQPVTVLTRTLVERWMMTKQGLSNLDRRSRRQINLSINSTYKHAKDVFAKKLFSEKYSLLRLPDLSDFLSVPLLPTPSAQWTRIPREQYEAMLKAANELRQTNPDLWLVNLLLRRLGLRNSELAAAERNWIIETETGYALSIEDRPNFQLKGVRPRTLPLSQDLVDLLLPIKGHLILPNSTKTDRLALIERTHNQWLRTYIPDRTKGNHELRKQAGSMVLTKQNLAAAQRFLGHSSQATTEKWYATYLQDVPALTAEDEVSFSESPHNRPPKRPAPVKRPDLGKRSHSSKR